jgi:hypothetical protein
MFNTKKSNQPRRVTLAALDSYLRQYPFKDLLDLPGYAPIEYELELASKYKAYLELLRRFIEEKEVNNRAFSELSQDDQKKDAYHPSAGSKEDSQRRLRYVASSLRLDLIYPLLKTAALELQTILTDKDRYMRTEEDLNLSEERRGLLRCNEIFATGLLYFFMEVKSWLFVVRTISPRPLHRGILRGCSLVLPSEAFSLLTERGHYEVAGDLSHGTINLDEF